MSERVTRSGAAGKRPLVSLDDKNAKPKKAPAAKKSKKTTELLPVEEADLIDQHENQENVAKNLEGPIAASRKGGTKIAEKSETIDQQGTNKTEEKPQDKKKPRGRKPKKHSDVAETTENTSEEVLDVKSDEPQLDQKATRKNTKKATKTEAVETNDKLNLDYDNKVSNPNDKNTAPRKLKRGAKAEEVQDSTVMPEGKVESKKKSVSAKKPKKNTIPEEVSDVSKEAETDGKTIYDFTVNDIKGNPVSLEKYKGNVCIIVNVASKCTHTKSNYQQFVELYDKYSEEKGLRILAFPCNQFGLQESGTSESICKFVEKFNVKFDMFEKINVNGPNAHALYNFLNNKLPDPKQKSASKPIAWNFTKFIVDNKGVPVERFASATKPNTMVDTLNKYW